MDRHPIVALAAIVAAGSLAGCNGAGGATLPGAAGPQALIRGADSRGIGKGVLPPVASPASLTFYTVGPSAYQTFTASIQYAAELIAVSSDARVVTVEAAPDNAQTVADEGSKSTTFIATAVGCPAGGSARAPRHPSRIIIGGGVCHAAITVTDRKGSSVNIPVTVNY